MEDKSAGSDPRSDSPPEQLVVEKSTVWKQNVCFFDRDRGEKRLFFLKKGVVVVEKRVLRHKCWKKKKKKVR